MLTVFGDSGRVPRRGFLQIGALGFGGSALTLADVHRAEAQSSSGSHKSVINIFLGGGPPHQDMW
ncbi:MAG: DUF1501 domain-containing protein, partial [Fuerstiella sp.]|nr:DUF1501 domain-containing protein [Fuerstiella sp.]